MKKKLYTIFTILMVITLVILLIYIIKENTRSDYDFTTNSITLYKMSFEENGNIYKVNKIITVKDKDTVTKLINISSKFNFKKISKAKYIDLALIYYLVFDDTGTVIQFGSANDDIGRIGYNFNAHYKGINGYKESEVFSCDMTNYVHIPLEVILEFKEYIP